MRLLVVLLFIATLIGAGVYGVTTLRRLYESSPPELAFADAPAALGQKAELRLAGHDEGMGFERLEVRAKQGSLEVELLDESFPQGPGIHPTLDVEREIRFDPREKKLRDGEVQIAVTAVDASNRDGGDGNTTVLETNFEIRTRPPNVQILSNQHNVAQGGTQAVAYRVGSDTVASGVVVGDVLFPGYVSPADPDLRVSVFAIPHDAPKEVAPRVFAEDELGNRANVAFYHKILPKHFPDATVGVTDRLIRKCRDEFGLDPALDDAQAFVAVNHDRRAEDHERLAELLASASVKEPLWSGAFRRLPSAAPKSSFVERRSYLLDGKVIDHAEHLGIDLASTENSPVPASADGVVIFADNLGIYGNTVLLDHGLGVATLYAHLTSFAVSPGDRVRGGQTVGNTGTTGLALGDHLHFGVYVQGVAVDPIEWWDASWMRARIDPKLELWRNGLPVAEQPAA